MANLYLLKEELKKTYRNYANEYDRAVEDSYKAQLAELQPGEPAPKVKRLVGADRNAFEERAKYYRHEVERIISEAENSITGELSAAPSTDAVNYITMLNMRSNLSQMDIDAAIEKYGSNYSAHEAISSIAAKQKLYTVPHEVNNTRRLIELAKPIAAKMNVISTEKNGISKGSIAFTEMAIDGNI